MKKAFTIVLCFLFLIAIASCTDKQGTNESSASSSTNKAEYLSESATAATTAQKSNELKDKESKADILPSENETTEVPFDSAEHNENSAPQILFLTLDNISEIETAYNNMEDEAFERFISEHPKHYEANGITNRSDARKVIDEIKETTIILLDGDEENVSEMYFYLERNEIQQSISVNGEKRIICTYYTPLDDHTNNAMLAGNPNAEFLEELLVDNVPVKLYRLQNNDSYFAELSVGNTDIFCRIINMENINELKTYFDRLTFVKIGDLLNE